VLIGGYGVDSFDGGAGSDTADFGYSSADWTVDLSAGVAGSETLVSIENVAMGSGDDTVTGDAGANALSGGGGADTLSGGDGADLLNGQSGDDVLQGGGGDDTLIGEFGLDSFDGGAGVDTADFSYSTADWTFDLAAGTAQTGSTTETLTSIENVVGAAGDDTLTGDAGSNSLNGGDGSDQLEGAAGGDTLTGGAGADTFVFSAGYGSDAIQDFQGGNGDLVDLSGTGFTDFAATMAAATQVNADTVIDAGNGDTLTLVAVNKSDLTDQQFIYS
jgi:Ca2+-binding RTX toxin-like protein